MVSSLSILANQVKLHLEYPLKNKDMAKNKSFKSVILMLFEQVIPQFFLANKHDFS